MNPSSPFYEKGEITVDEVIDWIDANFKDDSRYNDVTKLSKKDAHDRIEIKRLIKDMETYQGDPVKFNRYISSLLMQHENMIIMEKFHQKREVYKAAIDIKNYVFVGLFLYPIITGDEFDNELDKQRDELEDRKGLAFFQNI
jgi:hypothetical protein